MKSLSRIFVCLLALPSFAGAVAVDVYPVPDLAGAPVSVTFDGSAAPAAAGAGPAGETVTAYLQALASGTPERILSFWNPAEQDEVRGRMGPEALRKIREFFGGVRQIELLGEVAYGGYRIVLAELVTANERVSRAYPLKERGGKLLVTDELSADLFFSHLATGLADRLAKRAARIDSAPDERAALPAPPAQEVEIEGGAGFVRVALSPKEGAKEGRPVVLTFDGNLYQEGVVLAAGGASPTLPETALLAGYFQAWKTGIYDDLLAFWAPGQAEEFQKYFPRDSFDAHRQTYRNATRSQLLAELRYGAYRILLVEHLGRWGAKAEVYALRAEGDGPKLTYELLADPFFHLWRASLADIAAQRFGL